MGVKERAARWFCPMWGQMIRSLQSLHVWLSGSRGVLCQGLILSYFHTINRSTNISKVLTTLSSSDCQAPAEFSVKVSNLSFVCNLSEVWTMWFEFFTFKDRIPSAGQQIFRNYLLSFENKEILTRWRGRCVEDRCPMIVWCCPCPSVICSF